MSTAFYDKDFRKSFLAAYQSVPAAWKKAFFAAMAVNILVFFFDLAQFPLGDHDVGYEDGIPLLSGGRSGRWFAPVLYLLSGHVQIPVYTQLLAFASQIAAGMAADGASNTDAGEAAGVLPQPIARKSAYERGE